MEKYNDIIDLPYQKSDKYAHMSISDRAAQFAPFSALTGYSETVDEVERLTSEKIELDQYEIEKINRYLQYAAERIDEMPFATVTYFVPDKKKCGGAYLTVKEPIKNIDEYEKKVVMASGRTIPMLDIFSIKLDK